MLQAGKRLELSDIFRELRKLPVGLIYRDQENFEIEKSNTYFQKKNYFS